MANKQKKFSNARGIIVLLLILVAFSVFLPQLSSFSDSLNTLRDADLVYVGLAVIFWLTTYFSAALVYKYIALRPLAYGKTLLVQLASGFTNRLLPMGAGIVTLNVRYLIKNGHSTTQAATLVALNNILGFIGTIILIVCVAVLNKTPMSSSFSNVVHIPAAWKIITGILLLLGMCVLILFSEKVIKRIEIVGKVVIRSILSNPARKLVAFLASIIITVGYVTSLYAVGLAFNIHLSFVQVLLVMTLGVVAASITPTPGGIGGAEAGLVAALISVGITPHQALITALIYRFITFWLPILPGIIAFQIALRRRYI